MATTAAFAPQALATYYETIAADSPSAAWHFGEPAGSTVWTSGGDPSYALTGSAGVTSGVDGALDPDGGTAISLRPKIYASSSSWPTPVKTVELWTRTVSPSSGSTIAEASGQWSLSLTTSGAISWRIITGTPAVRHITTVTGAAVVGDGAWHHIAATTDGHLYIDGIADQTTTTVTTVTGGAGSCPSSCPVLSLGGIGLTADLDELALYNHFLTAPQVAAHFAAGTAGPDLSSEPTLSPDQMSQVLSLATNDPRLPVILGGAQYTVGPVMTWTKNGGGVIIGGVVQLDLASPATLTADWPMLTYNDSENTDPVYQTGVVHFTAPLVTSVDVSVDLNCTTVPSITPMPDLADNSGDVVVSGPTQPPACGDPPTNRSWVHNVKLLSYGNSAFYNYEFYTPNTSNPDGPIDLLVWGDAGLTKNSAFLGNYGFFGSAAYGYVTDSIANFPPTNSSSWDSDSGKRDRAGCHEDTHYRLWGFPGGAPLPNNYWGYFMIGQAHHDRGDFPVFCGQKWFGGYENAEGQVASDWASHFGPAAVAADAIGMRNAEGWSLAAKGYMDGNHWRSNDGRATKLHVCLDNFGHDRLC